MILQDSEDEKLVTLYILDDPAPESEEYIFVYVASLTEGARVAQPATDGGRKVWFGSPLSQLPNFQVIEQINKSGIAC